MHVPMLDFCLSMRLQQPSFHLIVINDYNYDSIASENHTIIAVGFH